MRSWVPPPQAVPVFEPIRAGGSRHRLRRSLRRRRRTVVAGLALTAVALLLTVPHGTALAGRRTAVLVAARDLPAGARLRPVDVAVARLPAAQVPAGAVTRRGDAEGRTLAGPVRSGEPITGRRLLGPALLAGYGRGGGERLVLAPVRIADAATAALLRPGDRIDVLAGSGTGPAAGVAAVPPEDAAAAGAGSAARVVASGVRVVTVPPPPRTGAGRAATEEEGALVVLAVPRPVAADLAGAAAVSPLSVTLG